MSKKYFLFSLCVLLDCFSTHKIFKLEKNIDWKNESKSDFNLQIELDEESLVFKDSVPSNFFFIFDKIDDRGNIEILNQINISLQKLGVLNKESKVKVNGKLKVTSCYCGKISKAVFFGILPGVLSIMTRGVIPFGAELETTIELTVRDIKGTIFSEKISVKTMQWFSTLFLLLPFYYPVNVQREIIKEETLIMLKKFVEEYNNSGGKLKYITK